MRQVLNRRHRDVLLHDWSVQAFEQGLTILLGCGLINVWQLLDTIPDRLGGPLIVLTKLLPVSSMLYLVWRFRPAARRELTSSERHIWALVPAYHGGMVTITLVNQILEPKPPSAPYLAVKSGMAFVVHWATIWDWLYAGRIGFFYRRH